MTSTAVKNKKWQDIYPVGGNYNIIVKNGPIGRCFGCTARKAR
jgi:hypothetical protein